MILGSVICFSYDYKVLKQMDTYQTQVLGGAQSPASNI